MTWIFRGNHQMCICNMDDKKSEYYFWDEMWNEPPKELKKDEKTTTENKLENNTTKP